MTEARTDKAVQVLDRLLEFFGEDGGHWIRGDYDDGNGRRCLVGALAYVRRTHRISTERAEDFLQEAMPRRSDSLVHFNDLCRSFTDLRAVIVKARVLALSDTERQRAAATVERWLLVEVERERAAKAAAGDKRATYNSSPGAPDETAAAPMRLAA